MTDLTIVMPSYNKERYIAEALDSVFAQKTRYSYRIVVVDDHSTDRTLEIVAQYERRHPGVITVLRSDTNLRLYRNVLRAYAMLDTPYFCVLDPDDYWLREDHIEKALDFLSSHEDYTIYSTEIQTLDANGATAKCGFPAEARDSDFADYLNGRAVIAFTQTCVYRNVVFSGGVPRRMEELDSGTKEKTFRGDSFRNFIHIKAGKARYEPDVDGCYRLTDAGVYQGLDSVGRYLLNAQLFADFWRYDHGAHYGLLLRSYELFASAKSSLLTGTGEVCFDGVRLGNVVREMHALDALFKTERENMIKAWKRRLPLRKRIVYRLFEKSLRKEFMRFGGVVW